MSEPVSWYVRDRGKVLGPFDAAQLDALRRRGQLTRFHELSTDRRTWTRSEEPEKPAPATIAVGPPPASHEPEPAEWFFAVGDVPSGPVAISELKRKAGAGEITPVTMVWKDGMAGWAPCGDVAGFIFPDTSKLNVGGLEVNLADTRESKSPAHVIVQAESRPWSAPKTSGLAVASLVLGLLWLCGHGSLLAVIFGAVAMGQIDRSRGTLEGKGLAITGLILGIIGVSGQVLLLLFPALARGIY